MVYIIFMFKERKEKKRTWAASKHFISVQLSRSVVSKSLRPHEPQHTRPPCPSPTPRVYPNPCPLSRWCHPTISSSVIPFFSYPQSFPASGSFQMIQLFDSGGQSIGVSASASLLPMNSQDWFPLGWTGWISLQSKGLSTVFSNTTVQSISSLALSFLYIVPIIQMKIRDIFFETIVSSLPGNQDSEPMAFHLWMSSALFAVTGFLNWSINWLMSICVENKGALFANAQKM